MRGCKLEGLSQTLALALDQLPTGSPTVIGGIFALMLKTPDLLGRNGLIDIEEDTTVGRIFKKLAFSKLFPGEVISTQLNDSLISVIGSQSWVNYPELVGQLTSSNFHHPQKRRVGSVTPPTSSSNARLFLIAWKIIICAGKCRLGPRRRAPTWRENALIGGGSNCQMLAHVGDI